MSDRIDIHDPLFELCARLGLVPEDVYRLDVTPRAVEAHVYRTRDGLKYVDDDGEPARERLRFEVTT